ncbi:UPF0481 protein At3g47200-like [Mercurialis annua]|uniref:UPF0481 protein At3g47200-like n=1 Tax=Mercurialis annua TaxID=3986 RepID=UPI0021609C5C|nr:UPF0481 protein At3g47200-like [Mercurialis annua]
MDQDKARHICIHISKNLKNSSYVPSDFSIFRVPDQLRRVNDECYEPQVVSIGPYHRGKSHLQKMESYKLQFLKQLLRRRSRNANNNEVKEEEADQLLQPYVLAMGALEKSARKCYEETISLSSEEFVEMMILDSCFVLEIFRFRIKDFEEEDDPKFANMLYLYSINRDLLLLENQIPFFVLLKFFNLSEKPDQNYGFIELFTPYLSCKFRGFKVDENCDQYESKHLLDFVHRHWFPFSTTTRKTPSVSDEWEPIRCAGELREAGIGFRRVGNEQERSIFDVKFKRGKLEIPSLVIEEETETILRNMIAFEQLLADEVSYVSDYMVLIDCLIDRPQDVQILCKSGIFENRLGDDDAIVSIVNKLGLYVIPSCSEFLYSELFEKVNKHCRKKHNKWIANLRHDYFHSPWAMISFLAAVVLLILTSIQTIYTVLSY